VPEPVSERAAQPAAPADSITQAREIRSTRIESLRALAALSVVGAHAYAVTHGYGLARPLDKFMLGGLLGVFLFFSLTGYLLFWPFAQRDFGSGARVSLGRYARNRAVRILPLYYFVVVVLMLAKRDGGTPAEWWHHLAFAENFFPTTSGRLDGPMWSLVVEVQFYVVLPLIAILLAGISRGRRAAAALVLLAAGAASGVLQLTARPPLSVWPLSFATTFAFFAAGMLLALLRLEWEERRPSALEGPLGRSSLWFLAAVGLWLVVIARYRYWPVLAGATFLFVGACVLPLRQGPVLRVLGWRPLAVVGLASYSLYLWHYPILDRLGRIDATEPYGGVLLIVALPLLIPLALVSYSLVEAPFLKLRRRWSPVAAAQTTNAAVSGPLRDVASASD
jgi:peptidoglycan/LPS O-acetylase OafA/YrhL